MTSKKVHSFIMGVTKEVLKAGNGSKPTAGQAVTVHCTGYGKNRDLTEKFWSTKDSGQTTFTFKVGMGQVIKGWDEGLVGLCKGAKATLILPPDYGYGDGGAGADIPGGATLNFDVEVIEIGDDAPPQPNLFTQIDTNEDGKLDKDEVKAYFVGMGQEDMDVDPIFEQEDTDSDGFISWDEFSGPKGDAPTGDAPTEDAPTGDEL